MAVCVCCDDPPQNTSSVGDCECGPLSDELYATVRRWVAHGHAHEWIAHQLSCSVSAIDRWVSNGAFNFAKAGRIPRSPLHVAHGGTSDAEAAVARAAWKGRAFGSRYGAALNGAVSDIDDTGADDIVEVSVETMRLVGGSLSTRTRRFRRHRYALPRTPSHDISLGTLISETDKTLLPNTHYVLTDVTHSELITTGTRPGTFFTEWFPRPLSPAAQVRLLNDPENENLILELQQKEEPMEDNDQLKRRRTPKPLKSRAKEQGLDFGKAVATGFAMGALDQTSEALLDGAKALSEHIPGLDAILDSEDGREFLKFALALVADSAGRYTNVPGGDKIQKAASLQATFSTAKLSTKYLALLRPMMLELTKVGGTIDNPFGLPEEGSGEVVDFEGVREKAVINGDE